MSNSAAFNQLRHLRAQLAQLGQPGSALRVGLARACAEATKSAIDEGFRTSTDPYGKKWAPLKSRTGEPLNNTGRHLRDRFSYSVLSEGYVIRQETSWATVHQYGATIKPRSKRFLRFRVRQAPTKSNKRGKLSAWIFAREVTIPQRQMMPERATGGVGPRFGRSINEAADAYVRKHLGA